MKYTSVWAHERNFDYTIRSSRKQIGISRLLNYIFSRELHEIHYLNLAGVNKD